MAAPAKASNAAHRSVRDTNFLAICPDYLLHGIMSLSKTGRVRDETQKPPEGLGLFREAVVCPVDDNVKYNVKYC
jgi:hypothetical protein